MECQFSYRNSFFKQHPEWLIVNVDLRLRNGDAVEIENIAHEVVAKREAKHPQHIACAGSFFMNPAVSDAKLLEEF
jgi:UDP-N-acetylenolpyruvoylglucosamine reductase